MFHIVLVHPEIPPNTGNIIRLAANTGCHLHLIEPLGFSMEDRHMRRAGLDYHEYARVRRHADWSAFLASEQPHPQRMFALTTHGSGNAFALQFQPGDCFIFGCETKGLPVEIREGFFPPAQRLRRASAAGRSCRRRTRSRRRKVQPGTAGGRWPSFAGSWRRPGTSCPA